MQIWLTEVLVQKYYFQKLPSLILWFVQGASGFRYTVFSLLQEIMGTVRAKHKLALRILSLNYGVMCPTFFESPQLTRQKGDTAPGNFSEFP